MRYFGNRHTNTHRNVNNFNINILYINKADKKKTVMNIKLYCEI